MLSQELSPFLQAGGGKNLEAFFLQLEADGAIQGVIILYYQNANGFIHWFSSFPGFSGSSFGVLQFLVPAAEHHAEIHHYTFLSFRTPLYAYIVSLFIYTLFVSR